MLDLAHKVHGLTTLITTMYAGITIVEYILLMNSNLSSVPDYPGPRLNIKTVFPRYGDSHVKDTTVVRLPYL